MLSKMSPSRSELGRRAKKTSPDGTLRIFSTLRPPVVSASFARRYPSSCGNASGACETKPSVGPASAAASPTAAPIGAFAGPRPFDCRQTIRFNFDQGNVVLGHRTHELARKHAAAGEPAVELIGQRAGLGEQQAISTDDRGQCDALVSVKYFDGALAGLTVGSFELFTRVGERRPIRLVKRRVQFVPMRGKSSTRWFSPGPVWIAMS